VANSNLFESTAKSRVTQIFQFLRAFYSLKTKTILQISDQPWTQWIRDIPSHECVWVASDSDLQIARPQPLGLLDHALHSPVHFGLEDIRVSEEIGNLGPHPALKLWSKEVRTPALGNADLPSLAGAFVAVAEVAYQTPAVFGAEHHSPKPVGALGVSGGIGEVRQPIGRQAVEKNT